MLTRSREELLVANVGSSGVPESAIPQVVGSLGRTLVLLLDEYHWITFTRRHEIPSIADLRQWLS